MFCTFSGIWRHSRQIQIFVTSWEWIKAPQNFVQGSFYKIIKIMP